MLNVRDVDGRCGKPLAIARSMGVKSSVVQYVKQRMSYAYQPVSSRPMIRDERTITAVKESIQRLGLQRLKVKDVHSDLMRMGLDRVPGHGTILNIMNEQLHLSFRKQNSQKIRYSDPRLDADRIDIIRIIATLLEENALIVTIDEASFNHTLAKHSQWQLQCGAIKQLNQVIVADGSAGPRTSRGCDQQIGSAAGEDCASHQSASMHSHMNAQHPERVGPMDARD